MKHADDGLFLEDLRIRSKVFARHDTAFNVREDSREEDECFVSSDVNSFDLSVNLYASSVTIEPSQVSTVLTRVNVGFHLSLRMERKIEIVEKWEPV